MVDTDPFADAETLGELRQVPNPLARLLETKILPGCSLLAKRTLVKLLPTTSTWSQFKRSRIFDGAASPLLLSPAMPFIPDGPDNTTGPSSSTVVFDMLLNENSGRNCTCDAELVADNGIEKRTVEFLKTTEESLH